jgi:hypothetical protein
MKISYSVNAKMSVEAKGVDVTTSNDWCTEKIK